MCNWAVEHHVAMFLELSLAVHMPGKASGVSNVLKSMEKRSGLSELSVPTETYRPGNRLVLIVTMVKLIQITTMPLIKFEK